MLGCDGAAHEWFPQHELVIPIRNQYRGLYTNSYKLAAIMTEVPTTGQRYLQVRHFLTRGIPASLMAFVVIVTLGYGLMYIAGL